MQQMPNAVLVSQPSPSLRTFILRNSRRTNQTCSPGSSSLCHREIEYFVSAHNACLLLFLGPDAVGVSDGLGSVLQSTDGMRSAPKYSPTRMPRSFFHFFFFFSS